jgi:hypothetical protein
MSIRPRHDRDAADRAWDAVLAHVPRRQPSLDLRTRLLSATRHAWPVPQRALRTEVAVTAGVVATAAGLTLAPLLLVTLLFVFDTGAAVETVARGVVWLVGWLTAGVSLWDVFGRAGRVAATAMTSPAGS